MQQTTWQFSWRDLGIARPVIVLSAFVRFSTIEICCVASYEFLLAWALTQLVALTLLMSPRRKNSRIGIDLTAILIITAVLFILDLAGLREVRKGSRSYRYELFCEGVPLAVICRIPLVPISAVATTGD